jgi:hypothetical protein
VSAERDSLKSRLAAARQRVDALLDRLPPVTNGTEGDIGGQDGHALTDARDEQA